MIPEHIKEKLLNLSLSEGNSNYFKDKEDFIDKVYLKYKTYDEVWKNVSRYQAYRVVQFDNYLLDKAILGEKYDAVMDLYESALETI